MIGDQQIFSVSEISQLLKSTVEQTFANVKIRGELSGITRAASGHIYLSIKDSDAVLGGIIWRGTPVNFDLAEGLEIIATGKLTTYPARSNYQIVINEIEIAGAGAILKMLEERKHKLANEGLFDDTRKKPLPKFPKIIGIVTSPTGAALQDMLNKLRDRLPVRVILYPAQVQGTSAAAEVAAGVKYFNSISVSPPGPAGGSGGKAAEGGIRPDVIIVARGGGALEDLLPFSEEIVVRAVAESTIPVISGVGHDPDWMLVDFAADKRAPTPTGAAEIVVPTKDSLFSELENMTRLLKNNFITRIQNAQMRLDGIMIKSPKQIIIEHRERLDGLLRLANMAWKNQFTIHDSRLAHVGQMLESLSYMNVLKRGFAIVRHNDNIVSSISDFALPATIEFFDGMKTVGT